MDIKLLSIIIPTKDRYEYLIPFLKLLKSFNSKKFDVIIQDNSPNNDEFLNYLGVEQDVRIKYFHTKENLSVIDNCDLAVSNATGKFICFMGDDDGVLPQIIETCEWLDKNNIDSAYFNKAHYIWPDLSGKYSFSNNPGTLTFSKPKNNVVPIDVSNQFKKVLRKGCTDMLKLPRLYHGIVRKEVLDLVKEKANSYFPGPSPDMANSIALANHLRKAVYIDFPIVITGAGVKSTSGQGAKHEHKGSLENKPFLPKNTSSEWSAFVPKYWSGPTIWAESALKSMERSDIKEVDNFNYSYLYASCLVFNPDYKKTIKSTIRVYCSELKTSTFIFKTKIKINIIRIHFIRAMHLVKNLLTKYGITFLSKEKQSNIIDINNAVDALQERFKDLDLFYDK
ncbi:hypothetical protein BTO05_08565 [Winogradskyella sp. PC-19]|uniref:glycosyltransferase family 2 protein n=1 Tax=Winogradskyella sp. PC-19 TaxID=754417 RepID=UPI000B3CEB31|nr:glycosyltransferase [Winogradskyella sp. PC-19]ARV09692.1 hypothetical protein BTO05_08565 [Winogradskyella sp. PC-19]